MCVIFIAHKLHPTYPLLVAANRDEFHHRPTAAAAFWHDDPQLLGGRDLAAGGSWFGVTRGGRFAAVTNFRDPARFRPHRRSRGRLVSDFLTGSDSPDAYLATMAAAAGEYNDFNLICGLITDRLLSFASRNGPPMTLEPGLYSLSNALLDEPWPKVLTGKRAFQATLQQAGDTLAATLLAILQDRSVPPDHHLPDTGIGLERERLLAPLFIVSPTYGTRSSTVLMVDTNGIVDFREHRWDAAGDLAGEGFFRFTLE